MRDEKNSKITVAVSAAASPSRAAHGTAWHTHTAHGRTANTASRAALQLHLPSSHGPSLRSRPVSRAAPRGVHVRAARPHVVAAFHTMLSYLG